MKVRRFAAAFVMVSLVALLCGCQEKQVSDNDGKTTIKWWCANYAKAYVDSYDEIQFFKTLQDKFNVDIEFIHPIAGQEKEIFNVMISSGEYPDIIDYDWKNYSGGVEAAAADGVILKLNDYINEKTMPNFTKLLDDNKENYMKPIKSASGGIYVFPGINENINTNAFLGPAIRKDWLDKLGLQVPESIEDWYNVLTAIKTNDPNGNGQADEIPLVDANDSSFMLFSNAYGAAYCNFVLTDDGKVVYGSSENGFKEFLREMNKWYREGLIDNEYETQNRKNLDYKMTADIGGAYIGYTGSQMGNYLATKKGSDYELVGARWPSYNGGANYCGYWDMLKLCNSTTGGAISAKSKNVDKIVEMFDWLYSEEGIIAGCYGVEGESYVKNGDEYAYTELITNNPDGKDPVAALAPYCIPNWGGAGQLVLNDAYSKMARSYKEQRDAADLWSQSDTSHLLPPLSFTREESEMISKHFPDIETATKEFAAKAVKGTVSIDEFDKFVEQIKQFGVDKVTEVYQAAYDRYQSN